MWDTSLVTTHDAFAKGLSLPLHSNKTPVTLKHELQKAEY